MSDVIQIIGIAIGGFIAYNLYFLSKRLTFQDSMLHTTQVKEQTDKLLAEIRKGRNSKIEFINIKRYKKDYPHNNDENRYGYTYQAAELKGYSYDGVEFFNAVHKAFLNEDDTLTLKKTKKPAGFNVFEVGVVPYEWIEHIDLVGDDTAYRPQFFTRFKGTVSRSDRKLNKKYKVPYKSFRFCKLSKHFDPNNDPLEIKYISAEVF